MVAAMMAKEAITREDFLRDLPKVLTRYFASFSNTMLKTVAIIHAQLVVLPR
jgi:hypothetical protein